MVSMSVSKTEDVGSIPAISAFTLNNITMGKSYKKSKVYNIFSGHKSDKDDKIRAHKKFRRKSKYKLKLDEELPTKMEEIADIWLYDSEGANIYDHNINPKYLRK